MSNCLDINEGKSLIKIKYIYFFIFLLLFIVKNMFTKCLYCKLTFKKV